MNLGACRLIRDWRLWVLVATVCVALFASAACSSAEEPAPAQEGAAAAGAASSGDQAAPAESSGAAPSGSSGEAVFPDPVVEENVRADLKLSDDDPIPLSQVEQITEFSVELELYVEDLTGIGQMVNLTSFDMTQNKTSDLSPLSSLTKLERLDVSQNQVTDLSPLAGLTTMTWFAAQDNEIADITPLAGLTGLTHLNLQANQIADISPLANMTELESLKLTNNDISDISALSGLSNLMFLELVKNNVSDLSPLLEAGLKEGAHIRLWGQPLDENSENNIVPALIAAGVKVEK